MNDTLGDRMKEYENVTRAYLPRRTNTIIRIDGKAFHTLTHNFTKPFDYDFMRMMDNTAIHLCKEIQGVKLAYIQSDEISLWLTDYDTIDTQAWFNSNIQKIVSVSASLATHAFNKALREYLYLINSTKIMIGLFDSRVFTIPEQGEVANYFLWRCKDATRNSLQMLARSQYSHSFLEGKSCDELKKRCVNPKWDDLSAYTRHGRVVHIDEECNKFVTTGVECCNFPYWNSLIEKFKPETKE